MSVCHGKTRRRCGRSLMPLFCGILTALPKKRKSIIQNCKTGTKTQNIRFKTGCKVTKEVLVCQSASSKFRRS